VVLSHPEREIPEIWANRFALIEKAGGPALPRLKGMPFAEIWKIKFNLLAFLLGPIYYAVKGMWKKGVTLFIALSVVLGVVSVLLEEAFDINLDVALSVLAAGLFSRFANVTYYRLVKERRNSWW
jgi:uncharacterized membrane protein